jgi:sugar transferase (PEP-CTERM system associated)
VPQIRILRHYIRTPYVLMALVELLLIVFAVMGANWLRFQGNLPPNADISALIYSIIVIVCMASMGVYEAQIREGFTGMMLRSAVAIFLLGSMGSAVAFYFLPPEVTIGRGTLAISASLSFVLVMLFRWLTMHLVNEDMLKRRVLVLGTGQRAEKIASRMRRRFDQRGFLLLGFARLDRGTDLVSRHKAHVVELDESLRTYCERNRVDEIVVALDERRRNTEAGGGLPLDELLECRLQGIEVIDIQAFIEREAGKIDTSLLHPSWMVFSDGFVYNIWRRGTKRAFDLVASIGLLLVAWPIMLLTAFAIWAESRFRGPILYRQERIGLDNRPFELIKFRSMHTDAEQDGQAVWATANDPRITRVGAFIRKTRLDEFPQVFNVLRGDMSLVGPRPERPQFVEELERHLPYYQYRHQVKPGLTGWAQLCYPYGASVEDGNEKLQYDLYYLKNHSVLLDMIILVQTVEVVLLGEGAR